MFKIIYSKRKIHKLFIVSGLLIGNLLSAQEMKISEHLITCSHEHDQEKSSTAISSNLRSGKNLTANEDFLAELMKIPKTAEFLFVYDPELTQNVEVRQAVEFAGEIMSREIVSSLPIEVSVGALDNSPAAASATFRGIRDFPNAPITGALYPTALANEFAGEDLTDEELRIRINSNLSFYTGIDGNTNNQLDLVSVLLHEFCHGLGFTFVPGGVFFEQFTDTNSNLLRNFPRNGDRVKAVLESGPFLNTPSRPTLEGNLGRSLANSLSHLSLESSLTPGNSLMNAGLGNNVIRNIGPIVRNVFRNMGYKLTVDAIANGLFVNIPNIILNSETSENNVAKITLKNIGDTTNTFELKEENDLIELPSKLISLNPGEIKIIKGKINPSVLENRFTTANIQVIRDGQISRNTTINITNPNINATPSILLSTINVESDVLTNSFGLESINVTNTSNSVIKVTSSTTSPNIQLSSEIIELKPNETKGTSFTIITNGVLAGNTLNNTIAFTDNATSNVLQELNVVTNVIAANDFINVVADDLNFNLVTTPDNTNNLIERTITITNVSNEPLNLEIRSLGTTDNPDNPVNNLINNTGVITLLANTSQEVNLIVDADELGNINLESTLEILESLTGAILYSSPATFNIEGVKNTRIDFIEDSNGNNRLFNFENPIIIGMEAEVGILGFNEDDSNIAPITEIIPSTNEIVEVELFTDDIFFDYLAIYTPTTLGPIDETLTIILQDDPENPIIVRITGLVIEGNQAIGSLSFNNAVVDNSTNLNIDAGTRILTQDEVLVDDFRLTNIGDIDLEIIEIQSSNASFRVSTDINTIPSGDFATLNLFFKPNAVGAITSEITIITNDPNTPSLSFSASGVGSDIIDRFDIETPSLITLNTGGKDQTKISVNNTSMLSIEYNATAEVEYEEVSSNLLFNDISTTGINITDEFRDPFSGRNVTLDHYHFIRVKLPFEVNYFGETNQTINITPYGFANILNLSSGVFGNLITDERIFTSQLPENDGAINSIASLGFTNDMYSAEIAGLLRGNAEVFYQINEDNIIIQWNNLVYNPNGDSINGQIIIHQNGAVDVVYGNVDQGENIENLLVGVENFNGTQGVQSNLATTPISTGTSRSFTATNGANFITNITPNSGRITPESLANLFVEVSAAGLPVGTYKQSVLITDRDSGNEELIEVTLNVVQDQPQILVNNQDPLQFNLDSAEVATETQFIEITNTGIGVLNISDLNTTTEDFIVNAELPIDIPVGTSVYVPVTYNPIDRLADMHEGELVIVSNDVSGNASSTINLIGNITTVLSSADINKNNLKIAVYPNPTTDNININLGVKQQEKEFVITLVNLLGQTVLTKTVNNANIKLSVVNLPQGNYIINLRDNTGVTLINSKFIKN